MSFSRVCELDFQRFFPWFRWTPIFGEFCWTPLKSVLLGGGEYGTGEPTALDRGRCPLLGGSLLNNDSIRNTPIDLLLPTHLLLRQLSLVSGVQKELVFTLINIAKSTSMFDKVFIWVGRRVLRNSFDAGEEVSGIDSNESVYANVANISCIPVQ
jgi:hypothetical protein